VAGQAGGAALRGARIGLASFNADASRVVRRVLRRAGLEDGEARFVPLHRHAQAVAAFRTGQVDAICYTDPTMTLLEQDGLITVVADTRTVRGSADVFGGPLPSTCVAAPQSFLESYPEAAQSLAHALVRALKWLQTAGPSDLVRVVPESYFQGDRAVYLAAFARVRESWTPDGLMPATGPETFVKTMLRLRDLPEIEGLDLSQTYTNRFARKAKVRFRL
jgi:NitT/TauT family transport system substrate-binding protein